jgi:hypothetical protein
LCRRTDAPLDVCGGGRGGALFETAKGLAFPHITHWQSLVLTIFAIPLATAGTHCLALRGHVFLHAHREQFRLLYANNPLPMWI